MEERRLCVVAAEGRGRILWWGNNSGDAAVERSNGDAEVGSSNGDVTVGSSNGDATVGSAVCAASIDFLPRETERGREEKSERGR
ncbi:hypothetical protein SOVF_108140 [Spinacia oleracea]|nr:hypothetical protein SOVF_108140 [Spinacia oleracea]